MQIPGVHVQTAEHPMRYTLAQLERAVLVAWGLGRGRLVLCEPPARNRELER